MSELIRFGVSLEKGLLAKFDHLIKEKKYSNRSEAIRDLIREKLVETQWIKGKEVAGAITLIYDHHKRELVNKLLELQHNFTDIIISTQHIHIDHDNCLEIIAVRSTPTKINNLTDTLKSVKGVKHGTLNMSTTGKEVK